MKETTKTQTAKIRQPVVVTGADGLLGRHMVNRLIQEKVSVRALLMPGQVADTGWPASVEVFYGDLKDKSSLKDLMKGAGTVCHNAAVVTDWAPKKEYDDVNVEGTRHLLDLSLESKPHFILASSVTVYGDKLPVMPCDETTPFGKPQGNYSRTKQIQERLCLDYAKDHDLPVTIIRPGNMIGRGSKPWVHDLLEQMAKGLPTIIGDGNVKFALCHVENVVEVFWLAMQNPKSIGQIYNGWDGLEAITWKQYVKDLGALAGYEKQKTLYLPIAKLAAVLGEAIYGFFGIKQRPPVTFQVLNQVASPMQLSHEKIKHQLGYQDKIDYKTAMKQIQDYILEKGLHRSQQ